MTASEVARPGLPFSLFNLTSFVSCRGTAEQSRWQFLDVGGTIETVVKKSATLLATSRTFEVVALLHTTWTPTDGVLE
jgi:hypothetical protein